MDRAYSLLQIKAVREDERVIEGIASTPAPDRVDDVVEPLGAEYSVPMPFLWQHFHDEPVGQVEFAKPTKDGIPFRARLVHPDEVESETLKERLRLAWDSVKRKLVRAVSIGFRPLEWNRMENGGYRFVRWEWLELSLVTIPANAEATITNIKSIDQEVRARIGAKASDVEEPAERPEPAAVGVTTKRTPSAQRGKAMNKQMTVGEKITTYEAMRDEKQKRMDDIQDTVLAEDRTKTAEEREEYETLREEIKGIDAELVDLREREKTVAARLTVIDKATTPEEGSRLRTAYGSVSLKPQVEKGILFTRILGAKYLGMVNHCAPWDIAKARWSDTPELEMVLRAAVVPGSTTDSTFATALVVLNNAANEFIEMLRAKEIIGRIPGLDRIPFNTQVPRGTTDPTAYWVGQGDVKPLSRPAFDNISLTFAKVAGIVPMTEELLKFSNPSAELKVRDGLISAIAYLTDRDFLDPTKAASTNISPASLTNGVTPTTATGITADAFRDDLGSMLEDFTDANQDLTGLVIVMTAQQAIKLSLMRNSLGNKEFPDITVNGGFIEGIPVITSTNIAATGGSPTDGFPIVAINAPDVFLAEEGVTVDVSREASLQMNDAPDSPETTNTVMVSLWQRNMVAIKAERYITWLKKHSSSVQFIQNAKYA